MKVLTKKIMSMQTYRTKTQCKIEMLIKKILIKKTSIAIKTPLAMRISIKVLMKKAKIKELKRKKISILVVKTKIKINFTTKIMLIKVLKT